jgi:hypothetical protein
MSATDTHSIRGVGVTNKGDTQNFNNNQPQMIFMGWNCKDDSFSMGDKQAETI